MESVSRISNITPKGKWQSKSNSDPESQWTFYSAEQNYLLERAYYDKKNEIDLGDSIVSLQDLRQNIKGDLTSQRPIRRITCEDNETDIRSERYFETELPKTINKIFGNLWHFISFFSRRNPEILNFTKQFHEFEQSNDLNGFNKNIVPQLINCLQEELLKPIEEQLKDHLISEKETLMKRKSRHEALISLLNKNSESFEEFYGLILSSYTMSTDLYLNLNKYLRNECWTAIDTLLPYAICLCKAFFSLKLSKNPEEENKLPVTENSTILYRGTALDEFALNSYQTKGPSKLFSWNSVTSTSKNRKIAESFMYENVDLETKKYPVLFIIEIPLASEAVESEYLKWINIRKYSAIPVEDEVILAPGSAFEIITSSTDQENRTVIQVKLKPEVESLAHQGLIMQGAFQSEMMSDKQVKIMCLEGEELFEALKNLAGNRLIEEVEFCLCIFDERSLREMLLTLPTLDKARGLKFISCKYKGEHEISSLKLENTTPCKIEEIEIYEVRDIFQILSQDGNFWGSLRAVNIDFRSLQFDDPQFRFFKFLTQLTSLNLNFAGCSRVTDEVVENLACQGLKYLTQLTSLTLDFSSCREITDESVKNLASQGLKYLTQLASLTLNFSDCRNLANERLNNLALLGLQYLTQLTSLTLDFSKCDQMADEELNSLATQGLKFLFQLTSLTLRFSFSRELTDEGVSNLASQGLRYLTQLTSLTLDFSRCDQITNKGVNILTFQGLKYFTRLISLTMNFIECPRISEEEVSNLVSHGLKNLTQLTSLALDFSLCRQIKDEGVSNIASQALQNIAQLTSFILNKKTIKQACQQHQIEQGPKDNFLNLSFIRPKTHTQPILFVSDSQKSTQPIENSNSEISAELSEEIERVLNKFFLELVYPQCEKISTTSNPLSSSAVFSMKNTASLAVLLHFFNLSWEDNHLSKVIDEGVNNLASQSLKQLTSLTLDFFGSYLHPSEGLMIPESQSVKSLTQLTSLTVHFSYDRNLSGEELNNMLSQALTNLTQLTSLDLNFYCCQITDEVMKNLASQGLKYLTKLTSLTLDFSHCRELTDEGMKSLACQGLKYLAQLGSLNLNFYFCIEITDEGVKNLACEGLQSLTQLTSLNLNFSSCYITDEGINQLASQGLKYLTQLTSLTLNFSWYQITDEGLKSFASQALKNLAQLTSLVLRFTNCRQITDEGVNNLIYNTIKYLTQLTVLTLDFSSCKITEFTVLNIAKMLRYSGFIQSQHD